ncbi:molecular chaperone DnaJ [soil metagenome]
MTATDTMRDFYEILGIARDAAPEDIKRAYRKVAMESHPDRHPGDKEAEARFKEAAQAYEVLRNPDKRARYDRFGHAGVSGNGGAGGQGFADASDIFSAFSDIFGGSAFGDVFARRGRGRGRPGSDLRVRLKLTLEEISEGVNRQIKVRKFTSCDTCEGSGAEGGDAGYSSCTTCDGSGEVRQVANSFFGQFVNVQPCPTCRGEGRVIKDRCGICEGEGRVKGEETMAVDIPAGVQEGHFLQIRGAGNAGLRGGEPGNLRVEIEEAPHEHFTRDGLDIVYDLHLSFPDATLGTEVEVPTLTGRARLQVDAGIQAGRILRMRGRGLPEVGGGHRGDEMIRVHVWTPQNLSNEERDMLEKLRYAPSFTPKPAERERRSFFDRVRDVFGRDT